MQRPARNVDFAENAYDLRVFCWVFVTRETKMSASELKKNEIFVKKGLQDDPVSIAFVTSLSVPFV